MQKIFKRLDELAGIETENNSARWLERIVFIFLILMVVSAPHSIAATQIAWLSGMFFWTIRLFIKPCRKLVGTPLDFALWSFFGWSVISSVFSYAPDISIDKLRNTGLFLIFYFVINNLRNVRAVKFLSFALIFSCLVSAAWSPFERAIGRGVEISGVSPQSLFTKAVNFDHDTYLRAKGKNLASLDNAMTENKAMPLIEGDAIIEVEGRKIGTPEELTAEIEKNETTYLECFRTPNYFTIKVQRKDLLENSDSLAKLGIGSWTRNRNWRYAGFYGQIITYAEVVQMIASLALGLFVALSAKHKFFARTPESDFQNPNAQKRDLILLGACLAVFIFALLSTFPRSAEIAFLFSAFSIVLANGNRKMFFGLAAIILPCALVGFLFMQQSRKVNFYDAKDESISYRQTVYREGFNLWTSSPRNFFLGVGMDSTKRYKQEWHLFDDGRLMTSHFHSTPLQLLVERGLPSLLLWLLVLGIYAKTLLKNLRFRIQDSEFKTEETNVEFSNPKSKIQNPKSDDWQKKGIILGCFGASVGFFVSSLVNYSIGDGEVAMVFFILMGLSVSICHSRFQIPDSELPAAGSKI